MSTAAAAGAEERAPHSRWVLERHFAVRTGAAIALALAILAGLASLDPLIQGLAGGRPLGLVVGRVLSLLPASLELLLPAACVSGLVWVLSSWAVDGQLHAARMSGYSPLRLLVASMAGPLLLLAGILVAQEATYGDRPEAGHEVVLADGGLLRWGQRSPDVHYFVYWPPLQAGRDGSAAVATVVRGIGSPAGGFEGGTRSGNMGWQPSDISGVRLGGAWSPPADVAFVDFPTDPHQMSMSAILGELDNAVPTALRAQELRVELAVRSALPLTLFAIMALAVAVVLRMPVHWGELPRRLAGVLLAIALQFAHHAFMTTGQLLEVSPWMISVAYAMLVLGWALLWLHRT